MANNDQAQSHQVQIQGATFSRLSNDQQIKELVNEAEKWFDFYKNEIQDLNGRLDNVKASIIKKDIQS